MQGALPFDRTEDSKEPQEERVEKKANDDIQEHTHPTEPLEEGPRLAPLNPGVLKETRTFLDKWRKGYHFRRLPRGHPLSIFKLFKNDQVSFLSAPSGG